jgi:hypothetical protein
MRSAGREAFSDSWQARTMRENDGWTNCNLRTTFAKIIRRTGVEPWLRLWHALRASCESDLAQNFSLATVAKWIGNKPTIALRHYVDPTEAAFERAREWIPSGAKRAHRRRKKRRSRRTRTTATKRRIGRKR